MIQIFSVSSFETDNNRSCTANGDTNKVRTPIKTVPPPLPKFPPPLSQRPHRNFRSLSANVQRLISHSNTSLHPDDMNDSNHSVDETHFNGVTKRLAAAAAVVSAAAAAVAQPIVVVPTTNGSKFKHPLSKNTGKLTQFGSDLVIDDSDGGYETPPENPYECKHNSLYDDVNSNVYEDADGDGDYDKCDGGSDYDNDKTPINEFEFDYDQVQEDHINGNGINNIQDVDDDVYDIVEKVPEWNSHENNNKFNEIEKEKEEAATTAKATDTTNIAITSTPIVTITTETEAESEIPTATSTPTSLSLKNASFIHSMLNKCETNASDSSPGGSAQNSPTLSQKSAESGESRAAIKPAKSQLFTIKAQVIEQSIKQLVERNSAGDSTVAEKHTEKEKDRESDVNKLTVPSNDANSTTSSNSSSKSTSKENGVPAIDLKRTKIRPLSSVSISSTSSSSSSASDEHSSNQNAISYLASVESLADHSENELAILSSSLTVTERACLEIIDSERTYTNDLGQVIRG